MSYSRNEALFYVALHHTAATGSLQPGKFTAEMKNPAEAGFS
jgi:hypothetical protein